MNPEIGFSPIGKRTADTAPRSSNRVLVSPPRRVMTRYVLPLTLFSAFMAVGAYSTRDALLPAIQVIVVQPVLAGATVEEAATAAASNSDASTTNTYIRPVAGTQPQQAGTPLFQAPGWIEPDPFTTLVSALVPGTIAEVNVREGDTVTSGQVVAVLDQGDARVGVEKARATLAVKQAELEAAQANWENPISLDETFKTARAEKARLEAEKVKLQRQSDFSMKQADISRKLGLRGADSALAAEKAALEAKVSEAELGEIDAKIQSQSATLEAAERRLKLRIEDKSKLTLATAQVSEASATLAEATLRLSRCKIVAPASGTVMRLHVTPGSMVSMDVQNATHVLSMYDPASLQARAEVPQSEASKIQLGLPAEIRLEAMPDRVFHGELSRIVHEADVQRNSLPVKVRILDPDPTLKPEMVVRLQFAAPSKPFGTSEVPSAHEQNAASIAPSNASIGGIYIPASLIPKETAGDALVWLAGPDMRAHQRTIRVGQMRRGDLREVASGINLSDKLITSNIEKLKEGARIRVVPVEKGKNS